jgi:hypothetical protein
MLRDAHTDQNDKNFEQNPYAEMRARMKRARRNAYLLEDHDSYKLALIQDLSLEADCYDKVMTRAQEKLGFTTK